MSSTINCPLYVVFSQRTQWDQTPWIPVDPPVALVPALGSAQNELCMGVVGGVCYWDPQVSALKLKQQILLVLEFRFDINDFTYIMSHNPQEHNVRWRQYVLSSQQGNLAPLSSISWPYNRGLILGSLFCSMVYISILMLAPHHFYSYSYEA